MVERTNELFEHVYARLPIYRMSHVRRGHDRLTMRSHNIHDAFDIFHVQYNRVPN